MATFNRVTGVIPAKDFERAKSWYADNLGLKPVDEMADQGAYYDVSGSRFLLYPSQFAGTNQATALGFEVDDVEATIAQLRENGVQFEEYDIPGVKTVDGVATWEDGGRSMKGAWCKDSEGNIIAIGHGWLD